MAIPYFNMRHKLDLFNSIIDTCMFGLLKSNGIRLSRIQNY